MDARTNSINIKDYPDRIAEIKEIIKRLDTPAKLVEIEVTIATGNTGFTNSLGMALGGTRTQNSRSYGLSTTSGIATNLNGIKKNTSVDLLQPSGALGLSGSMLFTGSKSIINTQLNLMETDGSGKVLSNPKIVTLNNREATIVSGNSISISVSTSDKIGLETIDTGISIKATPHIIEKKDDNQKDIMLDISIESSSLGDTTGGQINKSTNKINTNVIMRNGQTLILGGLFQYTKTNTDNGVPGLKDMPFLGFLFSTKTKQLNKNELVFFITPKIITSKTVNNKPQMHYQESLMAG
jgi:type IV pilus assembly protein PilQ